MAKSIVLDLLEQTIGRYVLNLDAKSLSVGLWDGRVELESLQLNKVEINKELLLFAENSPNLSVPFRIIDGSCDKISLKVPWRNLTSKPVIFRVSDLRIMVEPFDHLSGKNLFGPKEAREESISRRDIARINFNKLKSMSLVDGETDPNQKTNEDKSFTGQLITRIIENLQIEIDNIHIEVKGPDFNAGVNLRSINLITTDENGKRTFVDRSEENRSDFLFKELNLFDFCVFLEKKPKSPNNQIEESAFRNILGPLSFTTKLRMADDSVISPSVPKYHLRFNLPILSVNVSRDHIETAKTIQAILSAQSSLARPLFPEYRPSIPISKSSAILWWKYAVRCVGRLSHRTSWKEFFRAFKKRKAYILLYRRHAHHKEVPKYVQLSTREKQKLLEIENDKSVSIHGIMIWRNMADIIAQIEKNRSTKSSGKKSFFSAFKKKKQSDKDISSGYLVPLSNDDIKLIEHATHGDDAKTGPQPTNFKNFDLGFVVGKVDIQLLESEDKLILFWQITALETRFDANSDGSYEFTQTLENCEILDLNTMDTIFPTVVKSSIFDHNSISQLGEEKPLNSKVLTAKVKSSSDGTLNMNIAVQSFEIVLHPTLLTNMKNLVSSQDQQEKSKTKDVEVFSEGYKKKTAAIYGSIAQILRQRVGKQSTINLIVDFQAPVILLPMDLCKKDTAVLVFNLGSFTGRFGPDVAVPTPSVSSWFLSKAEPSEEDFAKYLTVSVNDVSLKLCKSLKSFDNQEQTLCDKLCDTEGILSPINFGVCVGIGGGQSVAGKICVDGNIKEIGIQLSTVVIYEISSILTSWTLSLEKTDKDATKKTKNVGDNRDSNSAVGLTDIETIDRPQIENRTEVKAYFSFELQRFSISLRNSKFESLITEMNHFETSLTLNDDDSKIQHIRLRSLWIADGLQNGLVRQDRTLSHSRLPISNLKLSDVSHDFMRSQLDRIYSTNDEYEDSNVIDFTIKSFPRQMKSVGDIDKAKLTDFQTHVEMSFLGLSVNINPSSIFEILCLLQEYKENYFEAVNNIASKKEEQKIIRDDVDKFKEKLKKQLKESNVSIMVSSKMSLFDFSLRSGKTDSELFNFEIHDVRLNYSMISKGEQFIKTFESHVNNIVCKSGTFEFLPDPIQLFGKGLATRNSELKEGELVVIKLKQSNQQIIFDTAIREVEIICFPELQTPIRDFLGFKRYKRQGLPEQDTPSNNMNSEKNLVAKMNDTATLQNEPKRILNISVIMRKIRLNLYALPPGFKGLNGHLESARLSYSEGIVLESGFTARSRIKQNAITNLMEKANAEVKMTGLEVYSSKGQMNDLIQILDPVECSFTAACRLSEKVNIDVDINVTSQISFDVSMDNVGILNRTAMSFQKLNSNKIAEKNSVSSTHEIENTAKHQNDPLKNTQNISFLMKSSVPGLTITLINDVLGTDEAVFKIMLGKTTLQVEILNGPMELGESIGPFFYFQINSSLNADSFFSAMNIWQPIVVEPCQIEFTGSRGLRKDETESKTVTSIGINVESFHLLFADHFLMNIVSALRMWKIYSKTITRLMNEITLHEKNLHDGLAISYLDKNLIHEKVASLLKLPPYELENRTGCKILFEIQDSKIREECESGKSCRFSFCYGRKSGHGGKRAYGQDLLDSRTLTIYLQNDKIVLENLDDEINGSFRPHIVDCGLCVFSCVQKIGNKTILSLRSMVDIINQTSFPIDISVGDLLIGSCVRNKTEVASSQNEDDSSVRENKGNEDDSQSIGIPCFLLKDDITSTKSIAIVTISPKISDLDHEKISGSFHVPSPNIMKNLSDTMSNWTIQEFTCLPHNITLQVMIKFTKTKYSSILVDAFIQPKAIIYNSLPVALSIRACHGNIYSQNLTSNGNQETSLVISSHEAVEVYSPLSDINLDLKCNDKVFGDDSLSKFKVSKFPHSTESNDAIYVDFPYVANDIASKNFKVFISKVKNMSQSLSATNVDIAGKEEAASHPQELTQFSLDLDPENLIDAFEIKTSNVAVDHTCSVLFQSIEDDVKNNVLLTFAQDITPISTFSTFWSPSRFQNVTILPDKDIWLRIVSQDGSANPKNTSYPFLIEKIVLKEGGVDFTKIPMMEGSKTAIYAYRKLSKYYENVLHIVCEYKIFNYSTDTFFSLNFQDGKKITIPPSTAIPIDETENIHFNIVGSDYISELTQIKLGSFSIVLKSKSTGTVVGSMSIDTSLAERSSCFVIKIGGIELGMETKSISNSPKFTFFQNDTLRFNFKWKNLQVSLCKSGFEFGEEADKNVDELEHILSKYTKIKHHQGKDECETIETHHESSFSYSRIAYIKFDDMTVDYQRILKPSETTNTMEEHSQICFILNKFVLADCTRGAHFPSIIDTSDHKSSLLDMTIHLQKSDNENINVNSFDLRLWHAENQEEDALVFRTSERFVWALLDFANNILISVTDINKINVKLYWNDENCEFRTLIDSVFELEHDKLFMEEKYLISSKKKLFRIQNFVISPIGFELSFKRYPNYERYQSAANATFFQYFLSNLKFTINKAYVKIPGYKLNTFIGPRNEFFSLIKTFYKSELSFKILTLLSAATFQEWDTLAGREDGKDEYVEGDGVRMVGNVVGKSADFLFKGAGYGLGAGIGFIASTIGSGVKVGAAAVGADEVGEGLDEGLTGLGEGIGDAVKGAGEGTGKVLYGLGKGIGKAAGGLGGGLILVAQGEVEGAKEAAAGGFESGYETLTTEVTDGANKAKKGCCGGYTKCSTCCTKGCIIS